MRDNLIPQKNVAPNARGRNASIVPISSFDMRIVLMSIDKHNTELSDKRVKGTKQRFITAYL